MRRSGNSPDFIAPSTTSRRYRKILARAPIVNSIRGASAPLPSGILVSSVVGEMPRSSGLVFVVVFESLARLHCVGLLFPGPAAIDKDGRRFGQFGLRYFVGHREHDFASNVAEPFLKLLQRGEIRP